jgi:hypothetical protein
MVILNLNISQGEVPSNPMKIFSIILNIICIETLENFSIYKVNVLTFHDVVCF